MADSAREKTELYGGFLQEWQAVLERRPSCTLASTRMAGSAREKTELYGGFLQEWQAVLERRLSCMLASYKNGRQC